MDIREIYKKRLSDKRRANLASGRRQKKGGALVTKENFRMGLYCIEANNGGLDSFLSVARFMLTRSGPCMLVLVLILCLLAKIFVYSIDLIDCLIVLFFLFFRSFLEWTIHSYLHHARPLPFLGWRVKTPIYRMHIAHHRNPGDIDTFLFGGVSVLAATPILLLTGSLFLGGMNRSLTLTFAFMLCLMIHEVVHVVCHSPIFPRSKFMSRLVATHRKHHFINSRLWLGVSSPLADSSMGTKG